MLKKITTVLAATIALVLAGSTMTPAFAAGTGSNAGALFIQKNTVEWVIASSTTTQRTFTLSVPTNAKQVTIGFNYRISEAAQTRIINGGGQSIEMSISGVGPTGQALVENTNSSLGLYQAKSGNWFQGYNYTFSSTLNLQSGMNSGEARGNVTFQLGSEYAEQLVPAGTYTFTSSIAADGVEITPSLYDSSQDSIGLATAGATFNISGAINSVFPSGAVIKPTAKICADPTQLHEGDSITVTHIVNGVPQTSNTWSEWSKRTSPSQYLDTYSTNPAQGPSPATTETRVLTAEDATVGLKIIPGYWNTFTSDGVSVFEYDLSVYNDATSTEVSKSCAPIAPAAPVLSFEGRTSYSATVAVPNASNNTRVYGFLYKATDLDTVIDDCTGWVFDGSANCNGYLNSPGVDLATDYVLKARVNDQEGDSPLSLSSNAAQVTGPPAPNAPTLSITSTTSATIKIPKVSGLNSSDYYRATLYTTTNRNEHVAQSSMWACNQDYEDPTKMSCSVSADSLASPNQYVATAQVKNSSGIWSVESADSNIVAGISAGYGLPTPLSGLSTQGKARLVGDNALGTLLNSTGSKVSTTPDGMGGLYIANRSSANEIKIGKINGATSTLDSTFGSSGYVSVTINGTNMPANTAGKLAWFGDSANRKWVSTISSEDGQFFAEGTSSSTSATTTEINTTAFCRDHFNNQQAGGELRIYSAPTVRPLALASCGLWSNGSSQQDMILVKINQDGTLTELVNMTPQGANNFYAPISGGDGGYEMPELANSVNLSATGSEVAVAIAIVNAIYTEGNYTANPPTNSTTTAHSRVLWRVPANLGTPTSTALNYTTNTNLSSMGGPATEPTLRLQPFNNGTKIYAMVLKNATGCVYTPNPSNPQSPPTRTCATEASFKLHETNVANGNLNADSAAKTINGLTSTLTEFQAALPTVGNVLKTIVKSSNNTCGNNGCITSGGTYSPGAIDVTSGTAARGESVTYTISGTPVNALWTNAAGKLQWLFTKQNASGHSLVEWQPSEIASTPVSMPVITGGAAGVSLNAGGSKIEVTGTNLTLVTKVLFGTKEAKFTKTATKLSITVPSGTSAGSVAVTVTYTGGQAAVPAGTWNYMGATKRAQTLTPTGLGDPTHSGAFETSRNFSVASSIQGYNVSVVSKSPTICTYVSGVVDFIGNGTCSLQATQAGDAVTNASIATYEIYYESTVNASALYSTDAGKPTITLTGEGLTSVSKVMFGNIEVVPTKKTATSITVKVPAAPTAGANVDVSLKYTNGTVVDTDLTFDYVGTVKLSQAVTLVAGFSQATYGDAARTLSASSATADVAGTDLPGLPYVYASTTVSVCAVSGDQLRFLTAGTCTVKVTQAGNAGVSAAAPVSFSILVAKKDQTITVDTTARSITDVEGVELGAENSNLEVPVDYSSSDETICTVDGEGSVTGLLAGTCTIKVNAAGDLRYNAAPEQSIEVTVTIDSSTVVPEEDADLVEATPVSVPTGGVNSFMGLSDPSLQISWDKATGKLTPRATGVYTGNIVATLTFVKNTKTYTCTTVFGATSKFAVPAKPVLAVNASAKVLAAYNKALAAYNKAFKAAWGSKIFKSAVFCADPNKVTGTTFSTIKKVAKSKTEKALEAAALKELKNFTGNVTISVKRWRAWPTTAKNKKGTSLTAKTIPATKNVNTLTLG